MNIMETGVEKVPTYALCYLVNGDATGLTEQEVNEIDRLLREQSVEIVSLLQLDSQCRIFLRSPSPAPHRDRILCNC